jgi:deoxyguanosine kinase
MNESKYIVVDGLIRAGKTRLAQIISEKFNARLVCDSKENPFLKDFFTTLSRAEDSISLKTQKMTVSDYIFYRDGIYAHLILNDEELDIYKKMFNIFSENVLRSDLVVYLQISFSEMLRRIRESGSHEEKNVPSEYWREVFEAYNYYFFNYNSSPLLVVNMEKVDLKKPEDVQHLLKEIQSHNKGTRYYAPA